MLPADQYRLKYCANPGVVPAANQLCDGKVKIQDCSPAEKEIIYDGSDQIPGKTYIKLAEYLEDEKNCVGFCVKCPYYLYTDCNHGPSNIKSCDDTIVDLIKG